MPRSRHDAQGHTHTSSAPRRCIGRIPRRALRLCSGRRCAWPSAAARRALVDRRVPVDPHEGERRCFVVVDAQRNATVAADGRGRGRERDLLAVEVERDRDHVRATVAANRRELRRARALEEEGAPLVGVISCTAKHAGNVEPARSPRVGLFSSPTRGGPSSTARPLRPRATSSARPTATAERCRAPAPRPSPRRRPRRHGTQPRS